jgi:small subunit ribosomal protein S6
MRYYESLYIVNPNFEQERLNEVMQEVAEKVGDYGFKIINHRIWGKKRLAYAIQKHKYGTYVLLQFETEKVTRLADFERYMILNKAVLRNQTVRLEHRPEVFEDTEKETIGEPQEETKPPSQGTEDDKKPEESQVEPTDEGEDRPEEESEGSEEETEAPEEALKEEGQE